MGKIDEICFHRGPQVLVLECHREVRDMGGARAAGEEKWPSPFLLTNAGLWLAEEEKMSSPLTNRLVLLWRWPISLHQTAIQILNFSLSEDHHSRLTTQSSLLKKRLRYIQADFSNNYQGRECNVTWQILFLCVQAPLCPVGGGPGPGGPMGPYNPNPYNPGPPDGAP